MKQSHHAGIFKPFKDLKVLLNKKSFPLKATLPSDAGISDIADVDHRKEQLIFNEAMAGVKKISRENCLAHLPVHDIQRNPEDDAEHESMEQLSNLVKYGTGFIVSYTSEYIEGTGYCVNPEVARRLHRGEFSIQAHIDLHGLSVKNARHAFGDFLSESIISGKRTVLIIHGRGLSSPAEPILKTKIYQWLTSSPWYKWVIAFTSARLCDGGAGATYILLRQRPLTKRFRKKKKNFIDKSSG